MVLLIGNYGPDQQQSMQRFGTMMLEGLTAAGVPAELIQPQPVFGEIRFAGGFIAKWLAYVDKFLFFPRRLRAKLKSAPAVVHICDHSNAMYAQHIGKIPVVVTCHDLLAVRGALGEETDTPASATGKLLQRWILAGLRRTSAIACVSKATCDDAQRLISREPDGPKLHVIPSGLSYPYQRLERAEARGRLRKVAQASSLHRDGEGKLEACATLLPDRPFVLHVGSNLRRKNREAVLRIFARCLDRWDGQLVFAGERLSEALAAQAQALKISDRIVQLGNREYQELEALYNCATAFLFPSRFEGFGWPIIEAQACGCPVICSDRAPMTEVAGAAGLFHPPDDEEAFAADILRLHDPAEHAHWSGKSLRNAQRFSTRKMIAQYLAVYRDAGGRV